MNNLVSSVNLSIINVFLGPFEKLTRFATTTVVLIFYQPNLIE